MKKEVNMKHLKKGVHADIVSAMNKVSKFQGQAETSFFVVVTLPKQLVVQDIKTDNVDKVVTGAGNPYAVADGIIKKSYEDPEFAHFWNKVMIATAKGLESIVKDRIGKA